MTTNEENLAKNIGEQMDGKILCPAKCVEGQYLCMYGDFEDMLFCPHCEIDVQIIVSNINWNATHIVK